MSKRVAAVASGLGILLAFSARAADPPILPRLDITPGAVATSCTIHDICPHERPGLRGGIPAAMRQAILGDYEAASYCGKQGACELDHSVSVELCGATTRQNLWPQSYLYSEGARIKDRLENELHRRVCAGKMPLRDAQKVIETDWLGAYVKFVQEPTGDK